MLFVDLRGFHPDPAQPPADPAAVPAGFLRLLGLPGRKVPHDLAGRAAAFHGEAWTLDSLGLPHTRLGLLERATGYHRRALAI